MVDLTTGRPEARPTDAPIDASGAEPPILIVDDSRVSQRIASRLIQAGTGRSVICADNGHQALALIEEVRPVLVLTDLHMPRMDGFELVEAIRSRYPRIPVILMTAYGSEASAMRALEAGAAYYVPKKGLSGDLVATIRRLLTIVEGDRKRQRVLAFQVSRVRSFELNNDPELIAPLIELIREDFDSFAVGDQTSGIRVAVALQESLANAVYHGNLECSSELRQDDEAVFYDLARDRLASEPYRSRRVHVESRIGRDEVRIVIRDEGPGFDVKSLDKPFDPEDLMRVGGRGMILIRTFLDEVRHNEAGNEITLIKRKSVGSV